MAGIDAVRSTPSLSDVHRVSRRGGGSLALICGAAALLASIAVRDAAAQGEIRSVRIGRYAGHDRLVFELGALPVDVYESDGSEFQIEFRAPPPPVSRQTLARLADMGVRIAPGPEGTSVAIERRGRSLLAFRLSASGAPAGTSERVVVDVGRSSAALVPPRDGQLLRLGRALPEQTPELTALDLPEVSSAATRPGERLPARPAAPQVQAFAPAPARAPAPAPTPAPAPAPAPPDPSRLTDYSAAVAPAPRRDAAPAPPPPAPAAAPLATPPPPPAVTTTAAPAPSAPAPSVQEKIWVRFRDLNFDGIGSGPPTREDLLNLELSVSVAGNGDLVAERAELPVQTLKVRDLIGGARGDSRIGGSLLQQLVERIAGAYADAGKLEARIDIREVDLERVARRKDGALTINIAETPAP